MRWNLEFLLHMKLKQNYVNKISLPIKNEVYNLNLNNFDPLDLIFDLMFLFLESFKTKKNYKFYFLIFSLFNLLNCDLHQLCYGMKEIALNILI